MVYILWGRNYFPVIIAIKFRQHHICSELVIAKMRTHDYIVGTLCPFLRRLSEDDLNYLLHCYETISDKNSMGKSIHELLKQLLPPQERYRV